MTNDDWLDLLETEKEKLQGRGWDWRPYEWVLGGGYVPLQNFRDAQGFCPLCAFVEIVSGSSQYRSAWLWALHRGLDLNWAEAQSAWLVAAAADNFNDPKPELRRIRSRLSLILGVPV